MTFAGKYLTTYMQEPAAEFHKLGLHQTKLITLPEIKIENKHR